MSRGFTLIELLVVCGIIALLAAILLPALGRAREVAKSVGCMSNLHSIGLGLHTYVAAYGDYYPIDYQYNNGEGEFAQNGDGLTAGYFHWTAALEPDQYTASTFYVAENNANAAAGISTTYGPYPMQEPQYVCPSHVPHGFAPTNFTSVRLPAPPPGQVSEINPNNAKATSKVNEPYSDDRQAPRLSYVANEAIMPRKKYCAAHDASYLAAYQANSTSAGYAFASYDTSTYTWNNTSNIVQVQEDEITSPATTILIAEFSQNDACIFGSSQGGGTAYKSHRPTNAIKIASMTNLLAGKTATTPAAGDFRLFDGEEYDTNLDWQFYKLSVTDAMNDINAVTNNTLPASMLDHITYIDPNAHKTGSNYLFVDGHAAQYTLSATLDPNNYLWGTTMWSCVDKPQILNSPADNPLITSSTTVTQ
jgi:prepilin-type N-terminal cleavage/methylation domain-containing protein/prepilin-type processing-associated H-X9-DG protein